MPRPLVDQQSRPLWRAVAGECRAQHDGSSAFASKLVFCAANWPSKRLKVREISLAEDAELPTVVYVAVGTAPSDSSAVPAVASVLFDHSTMGKGSKKDLASGLCGRKCVLCQCCCKSFNPEARAVRIVACHESLFTDSVVDLQELTVCKHLFPTRNSPSWSCILEKMICLPTRYRKFPWTIGDLGEVNQDHQQTARLSQECQRCPDQ